MSHYNPFNVALQIARLNAETVFVKQIAGVYCRDIERANFRTYLLITVGSVAGNGAVGSTGSVRRQTDIH